MRKSPRQRRLEADYRAVQQLSAESSIFDFQALGHLPETYRFFFHGPGTYRTSDNHVSIRYEHEIVVELGAAYPRLIPAINWQTPIFHPNISSSGVVCLGGYGTNWVPSLRLDELCVMLWDMIRYQNYDTESPYNREAALWARDQRDFCLPLDVRSLRNRVAGVENEIVVAQVTEQKPDLPPVVVAEKSPFASARSSNSSPADDGLVEIIREPGASDDGITFLS